MNDLLSVVIPFYNEAQSINTLTERLDSVLNNAGIPHEYVFVDDGSADTTWNRIIILSRSYNNLCAVKLSRNFGKESAICAGLDAALGDCCVVLDADMQHPPEHIPEMYRLWKDEGFEVVEGVKKNRGKESLFYKLSAKLFFKTLKTLSGIDLNNASDFRLLDRSAVEAWKKMPESQTIFRTMSTWVGFSRTQVYFDVAPRENGKTKWSLFRLVRLALTAVTSFSAAPLHFVTMTGIAFLIFFFIMFAQTLYMKLMGYATEGFTTIILLQLIIGSILMISLGIIGLYIAKIYDEIKARPRYLVQRRIDSKINNS